MMVGSTPDTPYDTTFARGVKLCAVHASSDATTNDAAPSQMPCGGCWVSKLLFRVSKLFLNAFTDY